MRKLIFIETTSFLEIVLHPTFYLAAIAAFLLGISKSGIKGIAVLIVTSLVLVYGARASTGILMPLLLMGDIFAIIYYNRFCQWKYILKMIPWMIFGVLIGVFSAIVITIYSIIFNYLIDPEFMSQMMEVARDKMLENPNMTEEMVDQSMKFIEMFSNPAISGAFMIAMSAVFGLIYSLIGGLIMKREE